MTFNVQELVWSCMLPGLRQLEISPGCCATPVYVRGCRNFSSKAGLKQFKYPGVFWKPLNLRCVAQPSMWSSVTSKNPKLSCIDTVMVTHAGSDLSGMMRFTEPRMLSTKTSPAHQALYFSSCGSILNLSESHLPIFQGFTSRQL